MKQEYDDELNIPTKIIKIKLKPKKKHGLFKPQIALKLIIHSPRHKRNVATISQAKIYMCITCNTNKCSLSFGFCYSLGHEKDVAPILAIAAHIPIPLGRSVVRYS